MSGELLDAPSRMRLVVPLNIPHAFVQNIKNHAYGAKFLKNLQTELLPFQSADWPKRCREIRAIWWSLTLSEACFLCPIFQRRSYKAKAPVACISGGVSKVQKTLHAVSSFLLEALSFLKKLKILFVKAADLMQRNPKKR